MMATPAFNAGKHPRAAGGRFGATGAAQAAAAGHPTGAWSAGPVRRGTGKRGAVDPRVKAMQQALNAAGIGDERGHPLLTDGIDGAHTTAAVKKFQAANHLPQTGVVDAKTMVAILTAKPKPKPAKKTVRQMMTHRSSRPTRKTPTRRTPAKVVASTSPEHTGTVGGKEGPALY
jgi:peptidoglycan hydrolase-like protein with peptidoglycan-binding domain